MKPAPWTLAPLATRAPELWRECAFAFIYWGGFVYDLASRTAASDQSNVSASFTPFGVGIGHTGRVEFTSLQPMVVGSAGATLLSYANPPATGQHSGICQRIGNNNEQIEMRFGAVEGGASDGSVLFKVAQAAGVLANASADNVVDGDWHVFIGRYRAGSASRPCDLFVDAVNVDNAGVSANVSFGPSGTFVLGGLPGTAVIAYQDKKLLDIGWNRALSDSEIAWLTADPYVMFRPVGF